MLAEPLPHPPFSPDAIYAKTDAGRAEVARRGAALGARARSVLIMLDGQKRCAALTGLLPAATLAPILAQLEAAGLIVPLTPRPAAPEGVAATHLAQAKATMIRTAEAYLGLLAADVIRQVAAADGEEQLRRAVAHWHMAMQGSRHGREVAAQHLDLIGSSLRAPL